MLMGVNGVNGVNVVKGKSEKGKGKSVVSATHVYKSRAKHTLLFTSHFSLFTSHLKKTTHPEGQVVGCNSVAYYLFSV